MAKDSKLLTDEQCALLFVTNDKIALEQMGSKTSRAAVNKLYSHIQFVQLGEQIVPGVSRASGGSFYWYVFTNGAWQFCRANLKAPKKQKS